MFGKKLKELRACFKITQATIADVLGINQDVVSKIEHDKRVLTSYEIFKLSKKFDIPIGFFFGEVGLEKQLRVHFRATEELVEQDKAKIPLLKEIARKQYDIEDVLKIRHDRILRKYIVNELDYPKIRDIALSEREILGFDAQEPIKDLNGLLRSKGIKVLEPILEKYDINGMFLTIDDSRYLILINADNSPAVRNFSLAHEYGHYLINRGDAFNAVSMNIESMSNPDEKERIANAFAAEFLMPEQSFDEFVLTDESIALYMHNYRVSRKALIFRLRNLNRICDDDMRHYNSRKFSPTEALKKLEKLGLKNEDVEYYEKAQRIKKWSAARKEERKVLNPINLINNEYRTMVVTAYERGLITHRKTADYLFMDVDELRKIVAEKEVSYEV